MSRQQVKSKVKLPPGTPWTLKGEVLQPEEVWMVIGIHEDTGAMRWSPVLAHTADVARTTALQLDHQDGRFSVSEAILNEMAASMGKNILTHAFQTVVDVVSLLAGVPRYGVAFARQNPKLGEPTTHVLWIWAQSAEAAVQRAQRKRHTTDEPVGAILSIFRGKARAHLAAVRESGGVSSLVDHRWGDAWPARMQALTIERCGGLDKYEERMAEAKLCLEAYRAAKARGDMK